MTILRSGSAILASIFVGCSGPGARTDLYFENDTFANTDRGYTSGVRIDHTVPIDDAPRWSQRLAGSVGRFAKRTIDQVGFSVGHQLYTPEDIEETALILDDRPYAAWLYAGVSFYHSRFDSDPQDRHDRQTSLDLRLGVVGPDAGGEDVQREVHELIDSEIPKGWDNQLRNEFGGILTWFHRRRWDYGALGPLGYDALLGFGASAGNVFSGVHLSNTLRLGWNLPRDFDTPVVDPYVTSGSPGHVINEESSRLPFTVYLFAGADGRAVLRDIFLDGNTYRDSHSVSREELVGDLRAGLALAWGRLRLTGTAVRRSPQFEERDTYHSFGSLSLGWTWSR